MKFANICALIAMLIIGLAFSVYAAKDDCENLDGDGAKPIKEVGKEDDGKQNDYDEVIEEDDRKGVTYLSFIGGSEPKPNGCGLSPKNPKEEWTGWGGQLIPTTPLSVKVLAPGTILSSVVSTLNAGLVATLSLRLFTI